MIELVKSEDLFRVIDSEFKGQPLSEVDRRCGYSVGNLSKKRSQEWIQFRTADKILTALDLSHLFYSGEVPVNTFTYFGPNGPVNGTPKRVRTEESKTLSLAYDRIKKITESRDKWRKRAVWLEQNRDEWRTKALSLSPESLDLPCAHAE